MGGLLADYLTLTSDRPATRYDHYEQWIVLCPDDGAGEWFIYGSADGVFDEVQGPFSSKKAALRQCCYALWRICPREIAIIE